MKEGLRTYSGGSFDVIHRGHLDLLEWCRQIAGKKGEVVIALNTDDFIERFKGKKPIIPYEDRKALLEAFTSLVDRVIENTSGEDSKPAIMEVKPDVIVIGSDWLMKDYCAQMNFTPQWLEEQKIALAYVPRHLPISSTQIKEKIKET
jgi:cytidyltransferase-like protein